MDEKELKKELDYLSLKAFEVISKKAIKDFEVVSAANSTQNMDMPTQFLAQKTQYEYANADIYAKLQKCFKGLKTNGDTGWILHELIDARYSLVIREKQKAELKKKGNAVMAVHKEGNEILAACAETLKKLLELNLRLENLDLPEPVRARLNKEIIQSKKEYNRLADNFEENVTDETNMLETRQNT